MSQSHPSSMAEAAKRIKKRYGDEAGGKAAKFPEFARLLSGVLPLDVALAGGVPLGAVSIVYGEPSSGKTSMCLRLAAQFQARHPEEAVVWIDAENSWDPTWAGKHGVDVESIYVFKASTAEEATDFVDSVAFAEDAGLIVVDSIAALASIAQVEKAGDQVIMGGASKEVARLIEKVGAAHTEHAKRKHRLTTIYINQVRHKIGFVMGNPEALPGPSKQEYQAFLKLRMKAKPKLDQKIAPIPIYAENSATVTKKKFPVCAMSAEWNTILYPYDGWHPLDVNNAKVAERVLSEVGALEKGDKGFSLWGVQYPTKKEAVQAALDGYDDTVQAVVEEILNQQEG